MEVPNGNERSDLKRVNWAGKNDSCVAQSRPFLIGSGQGVRAAKNLLKVEM